jgi:hypothetical protein
LKYRVTVECHNSVVRWTQTIITTK